ncbi:ribonuclease domain-containing protein [Thermomonas paludicola]|uniref:ribonuclease domain-containing protein n=1 Tax=Thermomonas paludicola TaxID=2884874 RepID=UPI003CCCF076
MARHPRTSRFTWLTWLLLLAGLAMLWQQRSSGNASGAAPITPSAPVAGLPHPAPGVAQTASPAASRPVPPAALPAFLPPQALGTIALIQRGGPFPHPQDGNVFGNHEGRLPRQPRGWYREYTVDTPGLNHRGARRVVTGGNPPRAWYYSDDHYRSFRSFDAPQALQ